MKSTAKKPRETLSIWKNVCVDFMRAYQEQEVSQMISLCHDASTVSFIPLGEHGKGTVWELGRNLWTSLIKSFPDLDNTVHSISSEGERIVCVVSIRGTQAHDFAGIESTGGHFDSEHIFVFTLNKAHQIEHIDIEWDHEDFVRQLSN